LTISLLQAILQKVSAKEDFHRIPLFHPFFFAEESFISSPSYHILLDLTIQTGKY